LSRYKGGPALPRKLISQGIEHKQYSVEVYPLSLKVTDARDNSLLIVKLSKKVQIDFITISFVLVSFVLIPMLNRVLDYLFIYMLCMLVFDYHYKNWLCYFL